MMHACRTLAGAWACPCCQRSQPERSAAGTDTRVRVKQKRVGRRGAEGGTTVKWGEKHDLMQREGSCRSHGPLGNLLIIHLQTLLLNTEPRVANAKYRGLEIEWELLELLQNTKKYVLFTVTGKKKKKQERGYH